MVPNRLDGEQPAGAVRSWYQGGKIGGSGKTIEPKVGPTGDGGGTTKGGVIKRETAETAPEQGLDTNGGSKLGGGIGTGNTAQDAGGV